MYRCLLLSALALCGCHHGEPEAPAHLPLVRAATVSSRRMQPRILVAGVLAPLPGRDVKVGALVAGRVDRVFVAEGDAVKEGQLLAHVEAQPLRDRLTEVNAQKTQAEAARENARTRLERTEHLWKDGIASKQEVDDARAQFVGARSGVEQAAAVGGTAELQLNRASLRAPIAGVVAAILVPAGQPVDGNGTPVIEVADTRELDLRAPVSAGRIGEVIVGQSAELDVEGVGTVRGVVAAIAPLVDSATNTVIVRVRVGNRDGRLRGGMFARGAILGQPRDGLSVPKSALLPGDGGAASMVALLDKSGSVTRRAVQLGTESGDEVEVRAGLLAGERVIVAGGYALPDGAKVELAP